MRLGFTTHLAAMLLVSAAGAEALASPRQVARQAYTGSIEPGHHLAFAVSPTGGTIRLLEQTANTLDASATRALQRAPRWIRATLREALRRMDAATQRQFAGAINDAPEQVVDEVAFVVAHLAPEDRQHTAPSLIVKDARLIYELDAVLDYVQILEKGEGADRYTTLKYQRLKEGKANSFELPREIYYWWVVFPVLPAYSSMRFTTIDPSTGQPAQPPAGVTWREYYMADRQAKVSYRRHFMMRLQNDIGDTQLKAWGASAYGSLAPSRVGANEVIRGKNHEPVLVQFNPQGWRCCGHNSTAPPMPDGIYVATTIPVEKLALDGHPELLENLLLAGPGRRKIETGTQVVISFMRGSAGYTIKRGERRILLLRDSATPFGGSKDPNEVALAKLGLTYDVMSSTQFARLVDDKKLYAGQMPTLYAKIVVPSGQPLVLYQVLQQRKAEVEAYVRYGGSFQLHGATAADWSALELPGGLRSTRQAAGSVTGLYEYGNALLRDVLGGVKLLWNGVRRCSRLAPDTCPGGDRRLADSPDAIDRIGWWSGQMVDRCVLEHRAHHGITGTVERPFYPQRIVHLHYGNCGEQHVQIGAATRAALIPTLFVKCSMDHVWNEFYAGDGKWYPHDMGYSDSFIRVGGWEVGGDRDAHPTKTASGSVFTAMRGDGGIVNLIGRYPEQKLPDGDISSNYTRHYELTVSVRDADNRPVEGAVVSMITEHYLYPTRAQPGVFGLTDLAGRVTLALGDGRDAFINVASPLGHYPKQMLYDANVGSAVQEISMFKHLVPRASATAGTRISRQIVLSGQDAAGSPYKKISYPVASVGSFGAPPRDATYHHVTLKLEVLAELRRVMALQGGKTFLEPAQGEGKVDVYITDRTNYDRFKAGKDCTAALVRGQLSRADGLSFDLPDSTGDWYLIVSNKQRLVSTAMVDVGVELLAITPGGTDPTDSATGCACRVGGRKPAPVGLWLLLAGLAFAGLGRRLKRRSG